MSIHITIGSHVYDEDGDLITVTGKHFSDYDVTITETTYDDDGEETGGKVTEAIFTQLEINRLFGHGRWVTFDTDDAPEE